MRSPKTVLRVSKHHTIFQGHLPGLSQNRLC